MKRGPLTILSAAAILCVGTRALGQDARWLPPAEEHRLASGLTVVLAPDEALDDVTVLVRYAAGSADDPKGKDGLAHLTEHMMYAGSKHVPPGDYWRWIARAGGWNLNGQTYLDGTSYFVTVPPEELPVIFWLESDRMGFQIEALDAAKVDRERALVLDEMRDKLGDQGLGMFDKTGYNEVFPVWHPYYRVPDLRWVEGLELEDVRAFLRTWYVPRNATLIVVGRFDAKSTLELAGRYFGDLRGAEPPVRPVLRARWRIPDVHVEMRGAMPRSAVTMTWWSPPFGTSEDAALDVAAAILSAPEGRLQRALLSTGLATQAIAQQMSGARGSAFVVSVTVADRVVPDEVVASLERVVAEVTRGVSREECDRARSELTARHIQRLETSAGRASWLADAPWAHGGWGLDRYSAIGPTEVARAVGQVLVPDHRAVVVLRPDPRFPSRGIVVGRQEGL